MYITFSLVFSFNVMIHTCTHPSRICSKVPDIYAGVLSCNDSVPAVNENVPDSAVPIDQAPGSSAGWYIERLTS